MTPALKGTTTKPNYPDLLPELDSATLPLVYFLLSYLGLQFIDYYHRLVFIHNFCYCLAD